MKLVIRTLAAAAMAVASSSSLAAVAGHEGLAAQAISQVRAHAAATASSAQDAFALRDVVTDRDGSQHVRLERSYRGLPVIGGDLVVHLSPLSVFRSASLTLRAPIDMDVIARKPASAAILRAADRFSGTRDGAIDAHLAIYARGEQPVLAYDVTVRGVMADGTPSKRHFIIDATSLAQLDEFDDIKVTAAAGTGKTLTSGNVALTADKTGSTTYVLRDPTRGDHYVTDMDNKRLGDGTTYSASDNTWGDNTTSDVETVAADAMYGQNLTWDYYLNHFGRNGIADDGRGGFSRVHARKNYVNAFWSDDCFCMTYGDGSARSGYLPLVAIDVAGHEMTHGVTSNTAGLIYSGESGGLNEAISDIFGTLVEFEANNSFNPPNYLIGERVYASQNGDTSPTEALRYMFKPSLDGTSPDCYTANIGNLDVHYSSGVANHFFYLLTQGAVSPSGFNLTPSSLVCNGDTSLTAISRDKAAQIVYRALTVYMTSSTNYSGTRTAMLKAAKDLYGQPSTEYSAVADAWSAVNVN